MSHSDIRPRDGSPSSSNSDLAERLRGFGAAGLLSVLIILAGNLVIVPLSAVLVLIWAHVSRTPWRTLGFSRPLSWTRVVAIGIPFGVAMKLVMKAIVMPLLGGLAVNPRYHYLTGNTAALPWMLYLIVAGAGFGEETLFRGYFFERLGKLLGTRPAAVAATILLTSAVFALAHYPGQGVPGVQQAAVVGLALGFVFALTGQLWIPMIAHTAFDVTAVTLIYLDWESAVAHVFFS